MAKYKYPGSSGKESFSDQLVGRQITDGSSLMTNTTFTIDKTIQEKVNSEYPTNDFSDFYSLDDTDNNDLTVIEENQKIKFRNKGGSSSLFGSLKSRLSVTIQEIISNFPAGFTVTTSEIGGFETRTAYDVYYETITDTTSFTFSLDSIYNPLLLALTDSSISDTYSFMGNCEDFVLIFNSETFNVTKCILNNRELTVSVSGKPFDVETELDLFFRPKESVIETFHGKIGDLGVMLMNRESEPKYTATFKCPTDNSISGNTELADISVTWPVSKDSYNIRIDGIDFNLYLEKIKTIAEEIDNYKSNLFVRFMTAPQLLEFDTPNSKMESVLNLYGQNFDDVKKWIDNIAFMRNVSYDRINNIPDVLLKNLSQVLGFESLNFLEGKSLNDVLYGRNEDVGTKHKMTLLETEVEFYRRILINLAYLFKSKGTTKSIKFFMKFIGAPSQLIRVSEKAYKVEKLPLVPNLENKIYDVISGVKKGQNITYDGTKYNVEEFELNIGFDRDGYPVREDSLLPKYLNNKTNTIFFQKGSGWYKKNDKHTSTKTVSYVDNEIDSRKKDIQIEEKPFTFGEDYFDNYRKLPGLDYGYTLTNIDVSEKIFTETNNVYLNRKNMDIFLCPSDLVNYDIWLKSNTLELSFGKLEEQSSTSFAEFLDGTFSKLVTNSHVIREKNRYYDLESVYEEYLNNNTFVPYTDFTINDFVENIGNHWVDMVAQFVPSSTLWLGGNLLTDNLFNRDKFAYKKKCEGLLTLTNNVDFRGIIGGSIGEINLTSRNFRVVNILTGINIYPKITFNGLTYCGNGDVITSSGSVVGNIGTARPVRIEGEVNTPSTIKLLNGPYVNDHCSRSYLGLPIVCGFDEYLSIDYNLLEERWLESVTNLLEGIVQLHVGVLSYEIEINDLGDTIITMETDKGGCEKTQTVIGVGVNLDVDTINNSLDIEVSTRCDNNVTPSYETTIGSDCNVSADLFIRGVNNSFHVPTLHRMEGIKYYFYNSETDTFNEGYVPSDCGIRLNGFGEFDTKSLFIVDNANGMRKLTIDGLSIVTNDNGFKSIKPNVEFRQIFNCGYKNDNLIQTVNGEKLIKDIVVGDVIQHMRIKDPNDYGLNDIENANNTNDFSFIFDYQNLTITSIESLGSVKTTKIKMMKDGVNKEVELLPTMRTLCYYRNNINESFKIGFKLPQEINILKSVIIDECCSGNSKVEYYGDYIIDGDGSKNPVTSIITEICDPGIYKRFEVEGMRKPLNLKTSDNFYVFRQCEFEDHYQYDTNMEYEIVTYCCPDGAGPEPRVDSGVNCTMEDKLIEGC